MDITNFVAVAQGIIDENHARMGYDDWQRGVLSVAKGGRKFTKIVRGRPDGTIESVHCFVETATGDIFKAASFKAPAKHARGNINDPDGGASAMTPYGAAYLR